MPDLSGVSLGRYQIIEPLGEGGMAVVYKAYDTRLECDVAVKFIRSETLSPVVIQQALKRFEREAKEVASLTHSNIVPVTDYGDYEGSPYLVMKYIPGGTLKSFIDEHGQVSWQETAKLLIPIAEALGYAHSEGIIHRDIKPSNILLTKNNVPMLTDFGVAKIIEEDATQGLTGTNTAIGTPEYMAPEQVASKNVDARADLYALGVVFYEMITGRRPFEADTPLAVLVKQASEPLPRPSLFIKNLPDNLEKFLLKALAKSPADRYQTAEEMAAAMRKLVSEKTATQVEKLLPGVKRTRETQTIQQVVKQEPRKLPQKWLWIGLAALGIIVLFGGGYLLIKNLGGQNKSAVIVEETKTPPLPIPTVTLTSTPSVTPEPSPTVTETITTTPTSTQVILRGTLISTVACLTGPNTYLYSYGKSISAQEVNILGKNSTGNWFFIKLLNDDTTCWTLSRNLKTSNGLTSLPIIEDPKVTEKIYYAPYFAQCDSGWSNNTCSTKPKCWMEMTIPPQYFSEAEARASHPDSKILNIIPYILGPSAKSLWVYCWDTFNNDVYTFH